MQYDIQVTNRILEAFSEAGADLNIQSSEGGTALSFAASVQHESVAAWLIQNNADVNLKNNEGRPALIIAILEGNEKIVRMLIDAGANVNLYSDGLTPLHLATGLIIGFSEENFLQITMALVEAGADVLVHGNPPELTWLDRLTSRTAYDFALAAGNRRIAAYLRGVMEQRGWRRWHWPFWGIR